MPTIVLCKKLNVTWLKSVAIPVFMAGIGMLFCCSGLRDALRPWKKESGQLFAPADRYKMAVMVSKNTDVTFHALRHTYATTLIAHGVDIKTVASLLGDRMETAMNTYVHFTDEMRKSAAQDV